MIADPLAPARILGAAPLGQGGQILAIAVAPHAGRMALLGNHHVISVVDVAAGRITASIPCQTGLQFLAFADDDHLLAFDARGLVRIALDGAATVLLPREWDGPAAPRVVDVLVAADTTVLLESTGAAPPAGLDFRAEVHRAGATATIDYRLAALADDLGLAPERGLALALHAAALTPDGARVLALASVQRVTTTGNSHTVEPVTGVVLIHDAATGRCLHARRVVPDAVFLGNTSYFPNALAVGPSGLRFAAVCSSLRVFDARTGALLHSDALVAGGAALSARAVVMPADDELIVATDTCVGRWAPGQPAALATRPYRERAFVLAIAASRTTVAIADDRALLLFARPDLAPQHTPVGHAKEVGLLALDAAGTRLASSDGASLIVWDLAADAAKFRIPARCWAGLAFAPDGRELMAAIDGLRPHLLDADDGSVQQVGESPATAIQWSDRVTCLHYEEVARNGKLVAELQVATGRDARPTARMTAAYLRCVPALARDGRRALVWSDMKAYGWDLERGVRLWTRAHDLCQAVLSPDGARALVTRIGAPPAVLDMTTGEPTLELTDVGDTLSWALAWSARGDRIAVGGDGDDLYVGDFTPGAPIRLTRLATGHRPRVTAAAFSGDGRVLATGGAEGSLRVFDLGPPPNG